MQARDGQGRVRFPRSRQPESGHGPRRVRRVGCSPRGVRRSRRRARRSDSAALLRRPRRRAQAHRQHTTRGLDRIDCECFARSMRSSTSWPVTVLVSTPRTSRRARSSSRDAVRLVESAASTCKRRCPTAKARWRQCSRPTVPRRTDLRGGPRSRRSGQLQLSPTDRDRRGDRRRERGGDEAQSRRGTREHPSGQCAVSLDLDGAGRSALARRHRANRVFGSPRAGVRQCGRQARSPMPAPQRTR